MTGKIGTRPETSLFDTSRVISCVTLNRLDPKVDYGDCFIIKRMKETLD